MEDSLDRKITTGSLLKFALPSIISMIFMSIYSTVDGLFVARLVSTEALSSVNIVSPIILVIVAIGFMIGTGGNALVARKLGEGKHRTAKENFTLLSLVSFGFSTLLSILGLLFINPLLRLLGANDQVYVYCINYAVPIMIMMPFALFSVVFQQFFITEGKANMGLLLSVIGGLTNIALDYLFIAIWGWGIRGAAIATGIGYCIPALAGLMYFAFHRSGSLYFVRPKFDLSVILKASTNGASEMITMLAASVTTVAFNNILMRLSGPDGVAAVTIIIYVQSILASLFMGYSSGISPIISFNYGKQNNDNLKKIYKISLLVIAVISFASLALSQIFAKPLVSIFTNPGSNVYDISVRGFQICALGFLFMGFNAFSSSMFTAFSDGRVSATLAFFRTLVFQLLAIITLPFLLGLTGVWLAIPAAELMGIAMTIYYFKKMKSVYKYA